MTDPETDPEQEEPAPGDGGELGYELQCPHCGHGVPIPTPDRSLGRQLSEQLDEDDPPGLAASRIVSALLPPAPAAFLMPSVTRYAERLHRRKVHSLETDLLGAERRRATRKARNWAKLMDQTFSIGGGVRVQWGKATIEHHEARITLLEQNRTGLGKTQEQHRWVIDKIKRTPGAQCLLDVPMSRLDVELSPLEIHEPPPLPTKQQE